MAALLTISEGSNLLRRMLSTSPTQLTGARILTLLLFLVLGVGAFTEVAAQAGRRSATEKKFTPPVPQAVPIPEVEDLPPPPPLEQIMGQGNAHALTAMQRNQLLLGRPPETVPPPPVSSVVRVIVGLAALGALAYAAGSSRVQAIERRLGVAHLMTTGLPFALLGLIASQPQVDILTESVLQEIAPVLPLGLGWIGFVVGARFEAQRFKELPPGTGISVFILTAVPLALLTGILLYSMTELRDDGVSSQRLRDSLLLATAGVMAARRTPQFASALLHGKTPPERIRLIVDLEQLAGVFGLMFISAFFRPSASLVSWVLPGTGWLFITLGIGTAIGMLLYAAFSQIQKGPQFAAILLGSVAFTAGMASYLRLSSLAVCFIAGAIFINLGGGWTQALRTVLERMERPVYFLFMIIAGALWRPGEWEGWVLMAIFISVRLLSKGLSAELLRRFFVPDLGKFERQTLAAAPLGALSVAIVISAQDLYVGATDPAIVTAVLGGALTAEILIRGMSRNANRGQAPDPPAPPVEAESHYEVR